MYLHLHVYHKLSLSLSLFHTSPDVLNSMTVHAEIFLLMISLEGTEFEQHLLLKLAFLKSPQKRGKETNSYWTCAIITIIEHLLLLLVFQAPCLVLLSYIFWKPERPNIELFASFSHWENRFKEVINRLKDTQLISGRTRIWTRMFLSAELSSIHCLRSGIWVTENGCNRELNITVYDCKHNWKLR